MHPSDILKFILVHLLESTGDQDSAKKIVEKGLPNRIYIHGEDSDYKIPLTKCIICKRAIVEKGKILIDYSPIFAKGGIISTSGEAIVPEKGFDFVLHGKFNRDEMDEMIERWNTKVSHKQYIGK